MNRDEARKKAQELVSRMTLEEKSSQLRYDAPAIKRLGHITGGMRDFMAWPERDRQLFFLRQSEWLLHLTETV